MGDFQAAEPPIARDDTRSRILAAAIRLLETEGRDAVTTRAVSDAAGIQPPTLYRLFVDKSGLLDAVAEYGFSTYLSTKIVRESGDDPVEDLRVGWDLHIDFGLSHPAVYQLMYCHPRPGIASPAAMRSFEILREHIRRIAIAGRLRVAEAQAAEMLHASGCGTVLTLLAQPENRRDPDLSAASREAVLRAITTDVPITRSHGPVAAAVSLRATLPEVSSLSEAERALLSEWLDRLAANQS